MQPLDEQASFEQIQRVGELRTLRGRRDRLGCALAPGELARLNELDRFFRAVADPDRVPFAEREEARAPISLVVTFLVGEQVVAGEACDVSPGGMFVATPAPLQPGLETELRVIDRFTGCEWRFRAEVVRGCVFGMGLRFIGIPLALRLGHRGAPPNLPELLAA